MPRRSPARRQHAPDALIKYLDPRLRADAFRVCGVGFLFQSADASVRRLVRTHWGAFEVSASEATDAAAVIQFSSRPGGARLRRLHSFVNDHFLFLSDGRRYLLAGYMYDRPWQFHCAALPEWDAGFIYYYIVEPVILDLLKKHGLLVWHGAAVTKGGAAVLLPGVSGSGKSTTALNLLSAGYRFLADDQVLLRARGAAVEAGGHESSLYLTGDSLRLLPEWKKFRRGGRYKKGRRWKSRIDLESFRPAPGGKPPRVKFLLFPRVTGGRKTVLEELTATQAMVKCLRQVPKEHPSAILGSSALQSQFEIYSTLVHAAQCYELHLGSDQEQLRSVLSSLGEGA
ncbi:MAG: hypothetical protein LC746_07000 [Acidobacteria bacterium]|nr:hypothetical protein [Acidobacteriota bacterium]